MRGAKQIEVVAVMPVVLGWNSFGGQVRRAELVCLAEFLDSLFHPPHSPQHVAEHVVGMWDRGRVARECGGMLERAVRAPHVLIGMRQVVMRGKVIRGEGQ